MSTGRASARASTEAAPPSRTALGFPWVAPALLALALAGAVFLFYGPELPPEPVLDDAAVALENGAVYVGAPSATVAPFYADAYRPIWRPLATATLRLN